MKSLSSGFTLIELLVTLSIMLTLLGLITLNLVTTQRSTTSSATVETMISDFRSQQTKAMVGDTEGRASPDSYGVYFGQTSYTLFHGATYDASDSANFTIALDPQFQFSPVGRIVIFSHLTGAVLGYSSLQNTITLQDISNSTQKTMTFNEYGIPVSLN